MTIAEFLRSQENQQFYWARSFRGWERFAAARPNATHSALATLEREQRVSFLITQNVDGLHQQAGSTRVLDLHGRNDRVICLDCRHVIEREALQQVLHTLNRKWLLRRSESPSAQLADGDSELSREDTSDFQIAACNVCGGVLKPDVVFFGESVPADVVAMAMGQVESSDGLLVVGSTLTVWSGYRFALAASRLSIPIAIINRGATRADELAFLKVDDECGAVLSAVPPSTSKGRNESDSTPEHSNEYHPRS